MAKDWVHVTRNRDDCRNPMDTEFKFRAVQDVRNFLATWGAVTSSTRTPLPCIIINHHNNSKWRMQILN